MLFECGYMIICDYLQFGEAEKGWQQNSQNIVNKNDQQWLFQLCVSTSYSFTHQHMENKIFDKKNPA